MNIATAQKYFGSNFGIGSGTDHNHDFILHSKITTAPTSPNAINAQASGKFGSNFDIGSDTDHSPDIMPREKITTAPTSPKATDAQSSRNSGSDFGTGSSMTHSSDVISKPSGFCIKMCCINFRYKQYYVTSETSSRGFEEPQQLALQT